MENNKHHSLTYCNELNVIPMPKLKAKEMDFYMKILYEIKANEKREFRLNASEFFKEIRSTNSDKVLFKMFEAFADRVLVHNVKLKEPQKFTAFVCFEKCEWDLNTNEIIITAQKDFYELLMDKEKPYTRLDLEEYWDLSSEYAKRLYPYLMQFRSTGVLYMKWDDFKEKLHIPKYYQSNNIDQTVLNPLIKDLTREHNLFSGNRVIFKGLTYEKIYKWGRGRGGKVIDIIKFEWEIQQETPKQKAQPAKLTAKTFDLGKFIGTKWHHSDLGNFEIISGDVASAPFKIAYKLENGGYGEFKFKTFDELRKKFDEFTPYAH